MDDSILEPREYLWHQYNQVRCQNLLPLIPAEIFSNYWMRLSRMWRIANREGCYPPKLKWITSSRTYIILHIIGKPNSITVLYSFKIFLSSWHAYFLVDFLQNFGQFLGTGYKQMFFLADSPQNVDKIHRAICFAYYCISWIQFKSEVQLFRLWIA